MPPARPTARLPDCPTARLPEANDDLEFVDNLGEVAGNGVMHGCGNDDNPLSRHHTAAVPALYTPAVATMRMHWDDLPTATRAAVAAHTGPIYTATTAGTGLNSEIAATLDTRAGHVFVKGLRCDHPRVWTQQREAIINPHVAPLAPRLLWAIDDGEWNLLGFEHLDGRPADYRPGADDLPLVAEAIIRLSAVRAPADVELKHIEQRLADYLDHPDDRELLLPTHQHPRMRNRSHQVRGTAAGHSASLGTDAPTAARGPGTPLV
ncbi:hypothetical protein [Streptomyces sp. NPDC059649]|uniref:hypothetical protein n=1 Tax=Streptomyces sp. NPDC059649 TaxID=3346895 RepID=UPI0036B3E23B